MSVHEFDDVCARSDTPAVSEPDVEPTEILMALKNKRRLEATRYLYDEASRAGRVTTNELARHLTVLEYGTQFSSDERKSVYTNLIQIHLDRLEDVGVIEKINRGEWRAGENIDGAAAVIHVSEQFFGGEE